MDRKSWSGAVCWLWQCVIWNAISQEQHQSGHHTEFHKLLAPCCLDTLLPEPVYYDLAHCYHSCILYGKEGGGGGGLCFWIHCHYCQPGLLLLYTSRFFPPLAFATYIGFSRSCNFHRQNLVFCAVGQWHLRRKKTQKMWLSVSAATVLLKKPFCVLPEPRQLAMILWVTSTHAGLALFSYKIKEDIIIPGYLTLGCVWKNTIKKPILKEEKWHTHPFCWLDLSTFPDSSWNKVLCW